MIVDEQKKEEIKKNHSKFIPSLSQQEKNLIEKLSGITGYKFNVIKDIFIALATEYGLELQSSSHPEIHIPLLFKILTIKEKNYKKNGDKEINLKFEVEPFYSLKNIVNKINSNEEAWVYEWQKTQIRNFISRSLDIKEDDCNA